MMTILVSSLDQEYSAELKVIEKDPTLGYAQAFEEIQGREVKLGPGNRTTELNNVERKQAGNAKNCKNCVKKNFRSKGHDEATCWRLHPEMKPEWVKKKDKKKEPKKRSEDASAVSLFSLQIGKNSQDPTQIGKNSRSAIETNPTEIHGRSDQARLDLDLARILLPPSNQPNTAVEILQVVADPATLVLDSGCGDHIFGKPFRIYLANMRNRAAIPVKLPDGRELQCRNEADFKGMVNTKNGPIPMEIKNVLYLPELTRGLLSVKRFMTEDYGVSFDKKGGYLQKTTRDPTIHFMVHPRHGIYTAEMAPLATEVNDAEVPPSKTVTSLFELHCALGHLNFKALKGALRNHKLNNVSEDLCKAAVEICRICKVNKIKRKSTDRKAGEDSKARGPMYRTHGDTVTSLPRTFGGKTGFSFLIDEKSKRIDIKLICHKDEYRDHFRDYHARATVLGKKLKVMRTDSAKELFIEKEFCKWLQENGIRQEASAPHAQYQNGFCESHIGIILRMANCALQMSGLPISFWGEALLWAVETWNRLPNKSIDWKSP
jgi:hypothetical protein